jgi:O-antigen/teichoic acid export membrane protein
MLTKLKAIFNNQSAIHYVNNTLWLFGERIVKLGIGFFVLVLLTRHLGPEGFGILSYAQSLIGIFAAFTTLGLEVILVRELAKNEHENDTILGTALCLKLFVSIIAIVIVLLINRNVENEEIRILTTIISATLLFQSLNLGIDTYFQANVLSRFSAISNTIAFLISSIIKLTLIFSEADLVCFAYALVFDAIAITIGYVIIYLRQERSFLSLTFNKVMAVSFLKNGWPMMMVAMAAFIYTRIDQVMIQYFMGSQAVGIYAAAIRVSELFYFIPLLITQSIFPEIIKRKEQGDTARYFKLLENLYKLVLWVTLPIVILIIIFSDVIISTLFGELFFESSKILSVLIVCLVLVSIGSVSTKILYVEGFEKKYLKRSIFGMFINIILNLIFIPAYGALGAALSTLITLFCIHYIYDLFDKELKKFYYLKFICFIPKF